MTISATTYRRPVEVKRPRLGGDGQVQIAIRFKSQFNKLVTTKNKERTRDVKISPDAAVCADFH